MIFSKKKKKNKQKTLFDPCFQLFFRPPTSQTLGNIYSRACESEF